MQGLVEDVMHVYQDMLPIYGEDSKQGGGAVHVIYSKFMVGRKIVAPE